MKKIRNIIYLLVISILLTGCVKYNVNMDIKKDKSMNFKIVYAMDKSLLEGKDLIDKKDLDKLEKSGFKVEKYSENNMDGFTLTKNIKNIDDVSSEDANEYSLSGMVKNGDEKLFKVKKGLLKNKYTANFKFSSSDSENSSSDNDDYNITDTEEDTALDDSLDFDETDEEDDNDYSGAMNSMSNMDMSVNVTLPYKSLNNNATDVKNDGKELKWNLSATGDSDNISFEFELYNMTTIYICIAAGVLLVIILIIVIVTIIKGKKQKAVAVQLQ